MLASLFNKEQGQREDALWPVCDYKFGNKSTVQLVLEPSSYFCDVWSRGLTPPGEIEQRANRLS